MCTHLFFLAGRLSQPLDDDRVEQIAFQHEHHLVPEQDRHHEEQTGASPHLGLAFPFRLGAIDPERWALTGIAGIRHQASGLRQLVREAAERPRKCLQLCVL
jgi:hypothetical protein